MIAWSESALRRIGMTVTEADELLALSNDDGYPTKQAAREAWENHTPATFSVPGSPLIYVSEPTDRHIARYAEQVRALGL